MIQTLQQPFLTTFTKLSTGDFAMNKTRIAAVATLVALFSATALHAQTGCTDSPENPTAILGLVGAGGWWIASSRRRIGEFVRKSLPRRK